MNNLFLADLQRAGRANVETAARVQFEIGLTTSEIPDPMSGVTRGTGAQKGTDPESLVRGGEV